MERQAHNNQGTFEQLQLNACSPQNTSASQTVSEQPGYSQTGNIFQTLSAQPWFSSHTESTVQSVSSHVTQSEHFYHEIADEDLRSLRTENTAQTVFKLPELSPHPTQTEQQLGLYREIAEADATRTIPVTEEHPVQLPFRVHTHRLW